MRKSIKISTHQKVMFSFLTIFFLGLLVARGVVSKIVKVDSVTLLLFFLAFLPWIFSYIKLILLTIGINLKKSGNLKSLSVTTVFVIVIVARTLFPNRVKIDYISLILIAMASLPWLMPYIKTLEINGLGKLETKTIATKEQKKEIEKTMEEVESANEIDDIENNTEYVFYNLRNTDSKLSLAGMRIELERLLRHIAELNSIDVSRQYSLSKLSQELNKHGVISDIELKAVKEISQVLNRAVHSELNSDDLENLDWIFDYGMVLIYALESKLDE